jgi:hypothetical protein
LRRAKSGKILSAGTESPASMRQTLLSCERLGRRCFTADVDPVYCEVTIRRLEQFRSRRRLGWQNGHPFEDVIGDSTQESSIEVPASGGALERRLF